MEMQPKYMNGIPGYTGYIPSQQETQIQVESQLKNGCIPGYGGYINGVRSENLYGKTYGKTTFETGQDLVNWGNDLNKEIKYTTTTKQAFQHPTEYKKKDPFTVSRAFNQEYEKHLETEPVQVQTQLTLEELKLQAYQK